MGELVEYSVREGVALVIVDNPPVNALSQPVRAGIATAIAAGIEDPQVGAIVIRAEGRTFPAGADLRDFRPDHETPSLGTLCSAIENSPKPVIAAIHGTALGGGLELALACHYRLASDDTQLGLPDVALGLVPSGGASQRLPRLVGPRVALDMLLGARPVSAEQAARLGLIDKAVHKNLERAALGTARNMIDSATGPRPSRDRAEGMADPTGYLNIVSERRTGLAGDKRIAAAKAVDLVEAALLLPFEAGLALEKVTFDDLVVSDQARGLRHLFLAERRTARGSAIGSETARRIERVGIAGSGSHALALLRGCLGAGMRVTLQDHDTEALAEVAIHVEAGLGQDVARGRLADERRAALLAAFSTASDPAAFADCELVIEAMDEGDAARRAALAGIAAATGPGIVLATTSTGIDLDALAVETGRGADLMRLLFHPPSPRSGVVEIARAQSGAGDLAATGVAFARALGKVPILPMRAGPCLSVTVFGAFIAAATHLLEEGAHLAEIDAVLRDYGFAQGPFQRLDADGLEYAPGAGRGLIAQMIARGWTGQRTGQGFYAYGPEGSPIGANPALAGLIDERRRVAGIVPRRVPVAEIEARCIDAMTNAGAALVADGVAAQPSDVDVALVLGFGFPRWRGGPMEAADRTGLLVARNRMRGWAEGRDGALWAPDPMFDDLIKNGHGFDSLNR
ncbi:enoyl-CoA hydratase-related protein [Sinisalibacter aestuarii]|uniref:Enoyl-CoA hydratase n=1 Tax=Sinisalibacter aestuarii TaxID=2949426 RepID=A0ABQ5LWZ4_9RHOB|nr:enoyl-CoA hydratase-related protein [Sinisalibacter aestuarii]GKY89491.1 enoyl-CoA hydratase [Sinisalibacter aestuarii]